MFNKFVEERSCKFGNLEKRINPNNLSYSYRLRDGNINPKEVLKNQINFKSDLGEIKKKMKTQNPNQKIK